MIRRLLRPRENVARAAARRPRRVMMTADTVGGVWHYSLDLSRGLTSRGIEVVIAAMGGKLTSDQRAEVETVEGLTVFESDFRLEWMADPWSDVSSAGEWLLDIAYREHPDLIHLNNFAHGDLAWGRPILMVGHSCVFSWYRAVRGVSPPAEWCTYRSRVARGLAGADLVVAPTRAMLDSLRRDYSVRFDGLVISNGLHPGDFRSGSKEPIIFGAGRVWDEAKNLGMLDAVASRLTWPVYIAGALDHPDGGTLDVRSAHAVGLLSRRQIKAWLEKAAVYALPARYEPFGLSALEAGLSGCALVLGDIPTLREVWADAAVFVEPDDADGLYRAILALVEDEPRRNELARRALNRARTFTASRMLQSYAMAYDRLLEPKPYVAPTPLPRPAFSRLGAPTSARRR